MGGSKLLHLNNFNLNYFLSYLDPLVVLCMHPVHIRTFSFLALNSVCQAMLALCADSLYIFAIHHSMEVNILLVVVCQPVEKVENPLPFLRGHILKALQLATTGRACFSSRDKSFLCVPKFLTGVEGVLFDASFPPADNDNIT